MLSHISIRHYTVVESLEVEFHSGLTVVTGETGAGKSIILDALGLCLGDRADPKAIRPGAERAEIHATFLIGAIPEAGKWLQARELDAGDELLLRRVLNSDGRSRAYINGRPATLQDCSALGELLIDIHGQHAHQSLLRRAQQRALLDEYAGVQGEALATLAGEWRSKQASLLEITHRQREHADREQLLRYQVEELDALALGEDELERLETELRQLENAETIQREAAESIDYCESGASAAHAALSALSLELHSGRRMEEIREMLESSAIQLGEARAELSQYLADRESDPERLDEIRKRLEDIYEQARKHRVMPERLADLHGALREELEGLDSSDERLAALQAEVDALRGRWETAAKKVTAARRKAATRLKKEVGKLLQSLSMSSCTFAAQLTSRRDGDPHPEGAEQVEFLISTNPGAPPQPLSRVASGGELSRISLAIQVVSAGSSTIPTLVFDEVDVGIGGAIAEVVGRLLANLGERAQVLCVTHLPQVASQGSQHLLVEKHGDRSKVTSALRQLNAEERVVEIARMLGGVKLTAQSRAHAREMLGEAG